MARELVPRILTELGKYASRLPRSRPKSSEQHEHSPKRKRTEAPDPQEEVPLVVGLNQVTRALERRELAAVLACRDDLTHAHILHHVPFQCRLGDCLPVALPKGSAHELSVLLGVPSVTLVGIKIGPACAPLVQLLRSRIPHTPSTDLSVYQSLAVSRVAATPREDKAARKTARKARRRSPRPPAK